MKTVIQKISYLYLLAVPIIVTALAFIIGHTAYKIYVPVWLCNACLMFIAARALLGNQQSAQKNALWYFIVPWMLIAIFGGMGPPPDTPAAWVKLAPEQYLRYSILMASGILVTIGFLRLKRILIHTNGKKPAFYACLLIVIALPLFILNMAYWGFFLTKVFTKYTQLGAPPKPDWLKILGVAFVVIRMIEVALIYLASALMAFSLRLGKLFSKTVVMLYICFALTAALLNFLPPDLSGPLAIANYLSYIPAFTLLLPYLMAVNLAATTFSNSE